MGTERGLKEGTILEGRYRIDRVVAEGGFGVVYAGHHLTLDLPIAIKVLRLEGDERDADQSARFMDEARTLCRLRHAHIVRVLDVGISQGTEGDRLKAWLVMEWCGGRTLRDDLGDRETIRNVAEVWTLMRPVVDAVCAAHKQGVIHRDIKPSNVMLVDDGDGHVSARLIDFGIAKRMDPKALSTISTGPRAFTPGYAAPEQLVGTKTGPWTDVHALALVLTEMLTGEPPYGEETDGNAIIDPVRPTPKKFDLDVGPWEEVLAKAMSVKISDRYKDASELLAALDETAEPAIVSSRASSALARTAPASKRRRAAQEGAPRAASGRSDRTELETLEAAASERDRSRRAPARRFGITKWFAAAAVLALGGVAVNELRDRNPPRAPASTSSPDSSSTSVSAAAASEPAPSTSNEAPAIASVADPGTASAAPPTEPASASAAVRETKPVRPRGNPAAPRSALVSAPPPLPPAPPRVEQPTLH